MRFLLEESFPQIVHVTLFNTQEKADFLEALDKIGAERILATTSETMEKDVEEQGGIHTILEAVKELGRCHAGDVSKKTGIVLPTAQEKLETLVKAGKIKRRISDGVPFYRLVKKRKRRGSADDEENEGPA